jgi:hypothetical protein
LELHDLTRAEAIMLQNRKANILRFGRGKGYVIIFEAWDLYAFSCAADDIENEERKINARLDCLIRSSTGQRESSAKGYRTGSRQHFSFQFVAAAGVLSI